MPTIINAEIQIPDIEVDLSIVQKVTVVPSDGLMLINGKVLYFGYPYEDNLHALQWNQLTGVGHLEFKDDLNINISRDLFDEEVLPYIKLYAGTQLKNWQDMIDAYNAELDLYNSVEERTRRLEIYRNAILKETDYLVLPDYPLDEKYRPLVYKYREAIRNIMKQDGAPWDGGGPQTPWPKTPTLKLKERRDEAISSYTVNAMIPSKPTYPIFDGLPLDAESKKILQEQKQRARK